MFSFRRFGKPEADQSDQISSRLIPGDAEPATKKDPPRFKEFGNVVTENKTRWWPEMERGPSFASTVSITGTYQRMRVCAKLSPNGVRRRVGHGLRALFWLDEYIR